MTIKVTNNAKHGIEISINQWGKDGDTSFSKLAPGGSDSWNRTDSRGFIMSVQMNGSQNPYYVQADSEVVVEDDKVTVDDVVISPANKNKARIIVQ